MTDEELLESSIDIPLDTVHFEPEIFIGLLDLSGDIFDLSKARRKMEFLGKRNDGASVFVCREGPILLAMLCTNRVGNPEDYDVIVFVKQHKQETDTTLYFTYDINHEIRRKEIMEW